MTENTKQELMPFLQKFYNVFLWFSVFSKKNLNQQTSQFPINILAVDCRGAF